MFPFSDVGFAHLNSETDPAAETQVSICKATTDEVKKKRGDCFGIQNIVVVVLRVSVSVDMFFGNIRPTPAALRFKAQVCGA